MGTISCVAIWCDNLFLDFIGIGNCDLRMSISFAASTKEEVERVGTHGPLSVALPTSGGFRLWKAHDKNDFYSLSYTVKEITDGDNEFGVVVGKGAMCQGDPDMSEAESSKLCAVKEADGTTLRDTLQVFITLESFGES